MALRIGVDLDTFQTICEDKGEGVITQSIAEKSGASFIVVGYLSPIQSDAAIGLLMLWVKLDNNE
ncbi:hypothetical protein BDW66DRAFT_154589 [Aspergillus desertorum]